MTPKTTGKLIVTSYKTENHKTNTTHQAACFFVGSKLEYVKVIPAENALPVGSIVTGKVTNIVPNIPAAFIALNQAKDMGFLSLANLEHAVVTNRKFNGKLQSGDEVLVKIQREPMKTKDAALTAVLDMTARYAVAQLGSGRLLFSKKLSSKEKDTILAYLVSKAIVTRDKQLIGIEDMDVTIRTETGKLVAESAESVAKDESMTFDNGLHFLVQDIEHTTSALRQLVSQASMRTCYAVHQKPVAWLNEVWHELSICGYAIEEYVTDDFAILKTLQELVHEKEAHKIRLYQDDKISLSTLYGIKTHLDELKQSKVWLPSGGYLCIEPTEAMIVIDVNTGKAIYQADNSEQLFYENNKEAAFEIARQLRLRNLSGMVIVDFINMKDKAKEQEILEYMKKCVKQDFSKVTVYAFTKLGLLELTRNKKSRAIHEIL